MGPCARHCTNKHGVYDVVFTSMPHFSSKGRNSTDQTLGDDMGLLVISLNCFQIYKLGKKRQ